MDGIEDMREAQKKAAKSKKALLLYEPWMDHKAKSPSLHDYVESPAVFPKINPRSKFKFDKDYLNSVVSKTPTPVTAPSVPTPPPTKEEYQQVPVGVRKTFVRVPVNPDLKTASPVIAEAPAKEESRKSNFGDFYTWLWNGREDDIDADLIEKMLFKTRPSKKNK